MIQITLNIEWNLKFDPDPSSGFFHEDPSSSIHVILLTNSHENNIS